MRSLAAAAAALARRCAAGGSTNVSCYSVQVLVPSLGESITDGAVAAVLKSAGDAVTENEVIAQIETDKVTVDIKAPSDGTILGVVVREADTVVPGQLIATLDDTAARARLIGAKPTAAAAASAQPQHPPGAVPTVSAASVPVMGTAGGSSSSSSSGVPHRRPGIHFPPRMTPDGVRISSLPTEQAAAAIAQLAAAHDSGAVAPAAAQPTSAVDAANAATPAGSQPTAAGAPAAPAAPSRFSSSTTLMDRMPVRRELTQQEMEMIELGGAAP